MKHHYSIVSRHHLVVSPPRVDLYPSSLFCSVPPSQKYLLSYAKLFADKMKIVLHNAHILYRFDNLKECCCNLFFVHGVEKRVFLDKDGDDIR